MVAWFLIAVVHGAQTPVTLELPAQAPCGLTSALPLALAQEQLVVATSPLTLSVVVRETVVAVSLTAHGTLRATRELGFRGEDCPVLPQVIATLARAWVDATMKAQDFPAPARRAKAVPPPEAEPEPQPDPAPEVTPPIPISAVSASPPVERTDAMPETPAPLPPVSASEPPVRRPGPKLFSVFAGLAATSRAYCARPSVSSCAEYDGLPDPKPPGEVVNWTSHTPYAGFLVSAEVFPLTVGFDGPLRGLGLTGSFGWGQTRANVVVSPAAGLTTCPDTGGDCAVTFTERTWSAALTYRHFFTASASAGLRVGVEARVFDASSAEPALTSNRVYPVIAADGVVPIFGWLNIELAAGFLVNPHVGSEEMAARGAPSALGFQLDAGLAGKLWGPLGYRLRVRYSAYFDRFTGGGTAWPQGGAAFESYTSLFAGPTVSF